MSYKSKHQITLLAFLSLLVIQSLASAQQLAGYTRIAVVPFKNLSSDTDKNWVGEGISDTLTGELAQVHGLILIERAQLAKTMEELRLSQSGIVDEKNNTKVGKLMSAKYLLVGSYQLAGGQILINARLVDVETGETKQAGKVQGKFDDIFTLQEKLAKTTLVWLNILPNKMVGFNLDFAPPKNISSFEYISRARSAYYAGKTDEAEKWLKKALETEPSNPDALMAQANIEQRRGKYDSALASYRSASEAYKKNGDRKNYAWALNEIGNIFYNQGKYNDALKYFTDSLKIMRQIQDEAGISRTLLNIGNVHQSQGQYDEALKFYGQSLEISRRIGDEAGIANVSENIGLCYQKLGKPADAKRAWEEAIAHFDKAGNHDRAEVLKKRIGALPSE